MTRLQWTIINEFEKYYLSLESHRMLNECDFMMHRPRFVCGFWLQQWNESFLVFCLVNWGIALRDGVWWMTKCYTIYGDNYNLIVKCSLELDTSTINIEVSILPATAWVQSTQFPLNSIYRSSSADTRDTDEWKTSQHVFDVIQGLLSCVTNSKYDFYFPSNSFTPSSKLSCST